MEVSSGIVEDFRRLFTGFEQAHGVFQPGVRAEPGQKQEGNSFAKAELVTTDLYEDHLRGKQGLGIVPAREEGICTLLHVHAIHLHHTRIVPRYTEIIYLFYLVQERKTIEFRLHHHGF